MTMKLKMLGILAVLATATAFAAVDGFSVARKPKEGEEIRFRMTGDVDFGGVAITLKGLVSEKVTKVEADGAYKVEQAQIELKANIGGQEQDLPSGGATTTSFAKDGNVKEITGEQANPDAYRLANLGLMIDPGKTINVGDTWTYEVKPDAKTGAVAAKAEYKLLGEEKVGEWDTLKIKATVKETTGTEPASSDGTTWISKADGSMVKSESKMVNAPFPGAPAPITATLKMERQK